MLTVEARPYGADMTPEERRTLLSRVYVVEPGIVFYREIPVQSVESIDLMLARLYELMTQLRLNGVDDPAEVKAAYLEGNGEVSVIKMEEGKGPPHDWKLVPKEGDV